MNHGIEPGPESVFIEEHFIKLEHLLGQERAGRWLDSLTDRMKIFLAEPPGEKGEHKETIKTVHDLVSLAGTAGFRALSVCCNRLEEGLLEGQDVTATWHTAKLARRQALDVIERIIRNRSSNSVGLRGPDLTE